MQLHLTRKDLRDDRKKMACSRTSREDFTPEVRVAIDAAGGAMFEILGDAGRNGRENYNWIHPGSSGA